MVRFFPSEFEHRARLQRPRHRVRCALSWSYGFLQSFLRATGIVSLVRQAPYALSIDLT
jgi:hypothetical protein